jgi:RHS repeat-associated protein
MPLEQFTYDQVGNRLSSEGQAPGSGMSTEYVYDFENRLIQINYPGMLAQYKYDPFGRRIEKNVNGTITRYIYDGPNIVTEYDGSWNEKAKYTHTQDIDDPLTVTQGANTFYYHKDGLGSVVNLTDASGNVAKSYTYKSFGEIHSETGSLVQPFAFTGREYDSESGLYFYRARYYDPRAGRFLTKDPIGFAGGDMNLYRYVFNDPINWVDPFGNDVKITITRRFYTLNSVIGEIAVTSDKVSDTFTGYTIEAARAGYKRNKNPIPSGVYSAFQRYGHNPYRIELEKVPGFDHIQIHIANTPEEVFGCFGVGLRPKRDEIESSEAALKKILKIIEKDKTGIIQVEIIVPDVRR